MEIDSTTLNTFLTALSTLILALIAWWNKQRTDSAVQTAAATQSTAQTNAAIASVTPGIAPAPITTSATTIPSAGWIQNPNGTVINIRSGRTYPTVSMGIIEENKIIAENAASVTPHTVITPSGKTFSTTFLQYWMDPAYDSSVYGEPSTETKKALSDAQAAYDNAMASTGKK